MKTDTEISQFYSFLLYKEYVVFQNRRASSDWFHIGSMEHSLSISSRRGSCADAGSHFGEIEDDAGVGSLQDNNNKIQYIGTDIPLLGFEIIGKEIYDNLELLFKT